MSIVNGIANYGVLGIGLNATAGSFAGALLDTEASARTTTLSGAVSGLLQSAATPLRHWAIGLIEGNLEGAAKTAALGAAFFLIYAVHVPVLMGVSHLTGEAVGVWNAIKLTVVGGGLGMIEFLAAQRLIDHSALSGSAVQLF